MVTETTVLQLSPQAKFQSLGADQPTVIVSLESGYLYTANQTTRAFLEAIDGRRSFGAILDQVLGQFAVEREKLRSDLTSLAAKMLQEKLLVLLPEPRTTDA